MAEDISKTHFQNLILTLGDGSKIVASIPARFRPGDKIRVVGFALTEPQLLGDGVRWEPMGGEEGE